MNKTRTIILILLSTSLSQEFDIDGNLVVAGNVQFGSIDSLEQVIIELQTQLSLLHESPSLGGIAEYTSNANWSVPDDVYKVYAEIWGGSGSGAGGGDSGNATCCGGGGGAGGYVRVIFSVSPGEILEVNVSDENSMAGFRRENGEYIVYATAGEDGEWGGGPSWEDGGYGGIGGTGHINEGIGIIRNGNGGGRNCDGMSGGVGGQPFQGSLESLASNGGNGGNCGSNNGAAGGSGYIYMSW